MKILKYMAAYWLAVTLLTLSLVLSAMIPRDAIRENMLESAQFLADRPLFGTVLDGVEGSRIDRYADAILLGIAWQYDEEKPLESVMLSSYYHTDYQNENENLLEAVVDSKAANQQYLRYWHGAVLLIRPLLTVFSLEQIYLLGGAVMSGLTLWLLGLLWKKKALVPFLGISLGLVMTAAWFVPLSLEYTWTFLLMLAMTILAVKLAYGSKRQYMGLLFLLNGTLTGFLDFLTTETLPLLVPLLTVLWIRRQEQDTKSLARQAVKASLAWSFGYGGMWLTKWLLAALVLGENVMPYVTDHVARRLGGDLGMKLPKYLLGALARNIRCLFPLEYGAAGILAALALVVFAAYVGYVYHKKQIPWDRIGLFALLGALPYIRYLILHNHAWLHCFFTYRAQLATILATVIILSELTDWRWRCFGNARKK